MNNFWQWPQLFYFLGKKMVGDSVDKQQVNCKKKYIYYIHAMKHYTSSCIKERFRLLHYHSWWNTTPWCPYTRLYSAFVNSSSYFDKSFFSPFCAPRIDPQLKRQQAHWRSMHVIIFTVQIAVFKYQSIKQIGYIYLLVLWLYCKKMLQTTIYRLKHYCFK